MRLVLFQSADYMYICIYVCVLPFIQRVHRPLDESGSDWDAISRKLYIHPSTPCAFKKGKYERLTARACSQLRYARYSFSRLTVNLYSISVGKLLKWVDAVVNLLKLVRSAWAKRLLFDFVAIYLYLPRLFVCVNSGRDLQLDGVNLYSCSTKPCAPPKYTCMELMTLFKIILIFHRYFSIVSYLAHTSFWYIRHQKVITILFITNLIKL